MKNITITLPEDVARWLRVKAAEDQRSVSRWIGELLEQTRHEFDRVRVVNPFISMSRAPVEILDARGR